MSPSDSKLEPLFSAAERDELGHLDYLLERLAELRDRGLIAADSYGTAAGESRSRRDAIDRAGHYAACLTRARLLATTQPRDAIPWAEQALQIDRERIEAWQMIVSLHWSREDDEAAIARCAEGAQHFPQLESELIRMRQEQAPRAELRRQRAQKDKLEKETSHQLADVRNSLQEHRFADAAAVCLEILAARPDHPEALANGAFALRRAGQLEESLRLYERLVALQPANTAWSRWVQELRHEQLRSRPADPRAETDQAAAPSGYQDGPPPLSDVYVLPQRSWTSFSSEFVKEHWQKLILSLAVLLIVVSSTVGAHILLGDLLWSREGKCTLALAGTLLLAALGVGLEQWGAGRAGRMMLITTLIVVPIHFMLAGELRLLLQPPSSRLVFLAALAAILVAMVRWVSGRLAEPRGARLMTAALLLISLGSAATTRGSSIAWSLQFAAFQLSPLVFLATVWAMGTRQWGRSEKEHREFVYTMFGVLGFALFSCLLRAGAYVLRLHLALYALPAMFSAISLVLAARRFAPFEPDKKRLALVRLGGYSLSGLAFALAFSSPYMNSALYSGNIVAVAIVGIALYSVSLWIDRHPAYLYLALGAYLAVRVGLWYFVAARFYAFEDTVALALGYAGHLPVPFRALVGVVVNVVLAALAIWFAKGWKDGNLARHCHYVGLPLSLVACAWSTFEPTAACICLSVYAVLYLFGVWLFSAPRLTYAGVLALGAAFYFGSTFVPGMTISGQALLAAAVGFAYWGSDRMLGQMSASPEYRRPWLHAAVALTVLSLAVATEGVVSRTTGNATGSVTFGLITALALLISRERPTAFWAYLALVSFLELTICATGLAAPGRQVFAYQFGLLFIGDALALLAVAEVIRLLELRPEEGATRTIDPVWAAAFRSATNHFAVIITAVADLFALLDVDRYWQCGVVFLLGSAALLWSTRLLRQRALVYVGLAQLVAGVIDLTWWVTEASHADIRLGWISLIAALLGLAFWMTVTVTGRRGLSVFYTRPCLEVAFLLTIAAGIGAFDARYLGRESFELGVAALAMNAVVTVLLLRTWRTAELAYAAVFHLVAATYLVLFSTGNNDPAMAYVLGLAAVFEALLLWCGGLLCGRAGNPLTFACARPLGHWAVFMTAVAVVLCAGSSLTMALVAVSLLLAVKGLPRAEWLYGTVAALMIACYWKWLGSWSAISLAAFALAVGFGLWILAVLVERYKPLLCRRLGLSSLAYEFPLFHSSMATGAAALALRASLSLGGAASWTEHTWLPLGLSVLCILMVRAYPRRICLHAGLLFLTWSVVGLVAPSLTSMCRLTLAGAGLAGALLVLERLLRPIEPALCARAGVDDAGFAPVVFGWACSLFGLAACLGIVVLVDQMAAGLLDPRTATFAVSASDWWAMLGAIGLLGAFVVWVGSDPDGCGPVEAEHLMIAFHWLLLSLVWWMGVTASPIAGGRVTASVFYPLATAIAALATAQLVGRFTLAEGWHELGWLPDLRSDRAASLLSIQASVLAFLAVLFTRGEIAPATVVGAILSALALGLVSLRTGWIAAAFSGGSTWQAAWAVEGLLIASRLGRTAPAPRSIYAAAGMLLGALLLWKWAGWLRSDGSSAKRRFTGHSQPGESIPIRLALAIEAAALISSLLAAALALAAGSEPSALWDWEKATGVVVLMAAALLLVLLVPRWRAEWLVYLAQALMLAAYVDFRMSYRWPIAADAAVLTLLGYLDLGLAELLDRYNLKVYARPARFTSLILPVLPLIQLVWIGATNEVALFHLLAAATFYSVACGQMRWKPLGYAAAVFYNAALWVLWSIFGWSLSDHFQFFMVPVGFSTILFAEVQRGELGRSTVNSIRSAGLLIIYASLAVPIWQFASFGAWLALLAASLVGIFLGIGLRLQTFLWLGLATFVLDVVYEMGRISLDHAMAKWAIMLALGLALVLFVALNEKKRIVETMRLYYDQTRLWE